MKLNKIMTLAVVALVTLFASSCSDDDDYQWAKVSGMQVYFNTALASKVNLSATETTYEIPIMRVVADEAVEVPLTVTNEGGLLNIPSSVSFAAGQKEATITVTYDFDKIGYDNYQDMTIAIGDENYTTPYGNSVYAVSMGFPSPWTSLGKCSFIDTFILEDAHEVEIQQNDLDPTLFRMVNPYGIAVEEEGGTPVNPDDYVVFKIYKAGETLQEQTLTQDVVYYDDISTAVINPNYDALMTCVFPGYFKSGADQSTWGHNIVVEYQENGLPGVVQLAPFYYMDGIGGWDYSQNDNMITIVFPGYTPSDYSAELAYTGKFIDAESKVFAVGNVTLGADVASAKAVVVPGRNAVEDGYNAIVQGLSDKVAEFDKSGEIRVEMPVDASGIYTMVVVTYDAEGNPQNSEGATFNYTASGEVAETWKEIAVGTFTYKTFFANEDGSPYDDEGLVLSQSEQNANHYKISQVFYGVDFEFTVNEDGTLTFEDQYSGYTHPDYGEVMVADMHALYPDDFPTAGYRKGDVFYFNTGYYIEAGVVAYDESKNNDNLETFTITGPANVKAKAEAKMEKSRKNVKTLNKMSFYGKIKKFERV